MIKDNFRETSQALDKTYESYSRLFVGKKEIRSPYWLNKLSRGVLGPFGGKGRAEDLTKATQEAAIREGFDLSKMSAQEILSFMRKKRIGVDCSGFVFWMLDSFDKEKGGNGIIDDIPGISGKFPASRANVETLTRKEISIPVEKVKNIKLGDMIRLRAGRHIAIITAITRNKEGKIVEIEYAHSSLFSREKGVHKNIIKIFDEEKDIGFQDWLEQAEKLESYKKHYLPQKGDGVRRLKIWS